MLPGVEELLLALRMDFGAHDRTEREVWEGIGSGILLDRSRLGIVRCLVPCHCWEAGRRCDREREDSCLALWAV